MHLLNELLLQNNYFGRNTHKMHYFYWKIVPLQREFLATPLNSSALSMLNGPGGDDDEYAPIKGIHKRRPHKIARNRPIPCPKNVRTEKTPPYGGRLLWTAPYATRNRKWQQRSVLTTICKFSIFFWTISLSLNNFNFR